MWQVERREEGCRLLNQLGLSAQRPLWRAYQQDSATVERWFREEFPQIRALAKAQKADEA